MVLIPTGRPEKGVLCQWVGEISLTDQHLRKAGGREGPLPWDIQKKEDDSDLTLSRGWMVSAWQTEAKITKEKPRLDMIEGHEWLVK
jgi:hypothetical protein